MFTIFSEYQDQIYKESTKFLNEIVSIINNQTNELGKVTLDLEPVDVSWNFTVSLLYHLLFSYLLPYPKHSGFSIIITAFPGLNAILYHLT